jgi:D-alanyl-D-alanine carboxypeptidase
MKLNKKKITAILSLVLTLFISTSVLADTATASNPMPDISAQAAISIDLKTNEIIYEKNIDNMMYPASTTKLLTALLLAESKNKSDYLTYTADAKIQPPLSLNDNLYPISVGDKMTAEDAMNAMLLYSANDVAYMIADNVSGNAQNFAVKMNAKIKALNLKNTHFVTPNGLPDKNHYTTAYDLSVISKAAYSNPWVSESMGTKKADITTTSGIKMSVDNRNILLGKDGCIGGKDGYTADAGRCLVAVYERKGRKILGVVMKSVYDANDTFVFNDMEKVINWSYAEKAKTLYAKNSVIKTENFKYKPFIFIGPEKSVQVPLVTKEDVSYYDNKVNKSEMKENFKFNQVNLSTLTGGKSIGVLQLSTRDSAKSYDLYSSLSIGTIIKDNILLYLGLIASLIALAIVLIILIRKIIFRRRGNKTQYY